jgi:hypothetical protein
VKKSTTSTTKAGAPVNATSEPIAPDFIPVGGRRNLLHGIGMDGAAFTAGLLPSGSRAQSIVGSRGSHESINVQS